MYLGRRFFLYKKKKEKKIKFDANNGMAKIPNSKGSIGASPLPLVRRKISAGNAIEIKLIIMTKEERRNTNDESKFLKNLYIYFVNF
ncbi:hypothetical protein [Candidatus Nitrosopumilus sediminis]|uniref:hypothetical protein n=1 Tax=Candidatus Nitrosopumilus sediminis TaxID=1229909 RepID=UPI001ED8E2C0|nr:hypothetical protein [Candidatus Nitrosopumilus sediminis]